MLKINDKNRIPDTWETKKLSLIEDLSCRISASTDITVASTYRRFDIKKSECLRFTNSNHTIVSRLPDESVYSVYRFLYDKPEFISHEIKFDITCINTTNLGHELPRTRGHYHLSSNNFERPYFDIYQVQKGNALVQLHTKPKGINRIYLIQAMESEILCLPPEMCHVVYNASKSVMAFTNWCTRRDHLDYESMKATKGPALEILSMENGQIHVARNRDFSNDDFEIIVLKPKPIDSICRYFKSCSPYIYDWWRSRHFLHLLNNPDSQDNWIDEHYSIVPHATVSVEVHDL